MTVSDSYPPLDAPRTVANAELARVVVDSFGCIDAYIDEIDHYCSMHVRLAHDQAAGWHLELGPYDLDAAAIGRIRGAIAAYDRAVGRDR